MKIISINNPITFGYKSVLKTEWLNGKLPSVKYGIYGSELTKDNVTLEHLLPHSKGGRTVLGNLALSKNVNNWSRSDKPFYMFFNKTIFDTYCSQFKGVKTDKFDGDRYIEKITRTVEKLLKQGK